MACDSMQGADINSRLYSERLEEAIAQNAAGTALYASGQLQESQEKYEQALEVLQQDLLQRLNGHPLQRAKSAQLIVLINLATCLSRLGEWNSVVEICSQVRLIKCMAEFALKCVSILHTCTVQACLHGSS